MVYRTSGGFKDVPTGWYAVVSGHQIMSQDLSKETAVELAEFLNSF